MKSTGDTNQWSDASDPKPAIRVRRFAPIEIAKDAIQPDSGLQAVL